MCKEDPNEVNKFKKHQIIINMDKGVNFSIDYGIFVSLKYDDGDLYLVHRSGSKLRFIKINEEVNTSISINQTSIKTYKRFGLIGTLPLYNPPSNENLETNRNFFMKVKGDNIIIVRQDTINTIKVDVFNGTNTTTKANINIPENDLMNIVIDDEFIKILLNTNFTFTFDRFNLDEILESIDIIEYNFSFDTIDAEFQTETPFGLNVSDSDIVIVDGNRFMEFNFESVLYGTFDFVDVNVDQIISIKSYTESTNTIISSNSRGYFVVGLKDGIQKNFYSIENNFIEYDNKNNKNIVINKLNQFENIFDILRKENNQFNDKSDTILSPLIESNGSILFTDIFGKEDGSKIKPLDNVMIDDNDEATTNRYAIDLTRFMSIIAKQLGTAKPPKFNSSLILRGGFNKLLALYGEQFSTEVLTKVDNFIFGSLIASLSASLSG